MSSWKERNYEELIKKNLGKKGRLDYYPEEIWVQTQMVEKFSEYIPRNNISDVNYLIHIGANLACNESGNPLRKSNRNTRPK